MKPMKKIAVIGIMMLSAASKRATYALVVRARIKA